MAVDVAQRSLLESVPSQVTLVQASKGQKRLVLVIRGGILSTGGQQQVAGAGLAALQRQPFLSFQPASLVAVRTPVTGWAVVARVFRQ